MKSRHQARVYAFQALYGLETLCEFTKDSLAQTIKEHFDNFGIEEEFREQAQILIEATINSRSKLDKLIEEKSSNWKLSRMNAIDRTIIRLAMAEIQMDDVPLAVIINEAVELAKEYGDINSSAFVNGILDGVSK